MHVLLSRFMHERDRLLVLFLNSVWTVVATVVSTGI